MQPLIQKRVKGNLPCPKCGSSDALSDYPDYVRCYSCHYFATKEVLAKQYPEYKVDNPISESQHVDGNPVLSTGDYDGVVAAIPTRNISESTCEKFGVKVKFSDKGGIREINFPYHKADGTFLANKTKVPPSSGGKAFNITGKWNSDQRGLFGQHLFPKGSAKYVTIVEGELDALAAYQMLSKYPVVSISSGAQTAEADCKKAYQWLDSFEGVYICFDNDKAGKEAAEKIADLLPPGKAFIVHLPETVGDNNTPVKDACDFLREGFAPEFKKLWWSAEKYAPSGLVFSGDLRERIKSKKNVESYTTPWDGLNQTIYGFRKGETTLVFAPPKVGKTQVLREVKYHLFNNYPDEKIGDISLEETPDVTGEGLMSLHAGKAFHLPDAEYTEEEWEEAFDTMLAPNRFVFYDAFATKDFDAICSRIRYLVKGLDCGFIFLDNVSVLVAQSHKDERKEMDRMASTLSQMANELDVALILVAHENRQGLVRGSAGFEQFCNTVIQLHRDKKAEDEVVRNTTRVFVTENRFNGETGPACFLKYDKDTTRMVEFDPDEDSEFKEEDESDSYDNRNLWSDTVD